MIKYTLATNIHQSSGQDALVDAALAASYVAKFQAACDAKDQPAQAALCEVSLLVAVTL